MRVGEYLKAIVSALVSGYAMFEFAVEPVIVDGVIIEAANVVTQTEWIRIGGVMVAAFGVVFGVPNLNKKPKAEEETKVSGDGEAGGGLDGK